MHPKVAVIRNESREFSSDYRIFILQRNKIGFVKEWGEECSSDISREICDR